MTEILEVPTSTGAATGTGRRAEPQACPFCSDGDLFPVEEGRWHCHACLRVFSVQLFGTQDWKPPVTTLLDAPPATETRSPTPAPAAPAAPTAPTAPAAPHQATRGSLPTRPEDVRREIEKDPVAFAERANDVLDGADPFTILSWAGRAFGRDLVVTASMGDTVMAHIAGRAVPGVDMVFVDTGYHFIETIGTADAVKYTYPVRLISVSAEQSRAEHEAEHGELFRTNPDKCCAIRKVAPLNKALANYRAWATGLRRDDSLNRAFTPTVTWDHKRKLIKISPIAPWTDEDVERYLAQNPDVVSNPLLQLDYRSIGCEPCTQPVKPGEDARSGRWAGMAKTECGIHI